MVKGSLSIVETVRVAFVDGKCRVGSESCGPHRNNDSTPLKS